MVFETQDDQIVLVLTGEIQNRRGRLSVHHVIADEEPGLASCESIDTEAVGLHSRGTLRVIREQTCNTSIAASHGFAAART